LLPGLCSASVRATTNPRAPGGDEDGVFGEFHRGFLNLKLMDELVQVVKRSPNIGRPLPERDCGGWHADETNKNSSIVNANAPSALLQIFGKLPACGVPDLNHR
jgi:hypothetical protein